ncbi:scopoletin glucosyltransferase-like [Iris pallida]|uniref:Glycosyltransferase n=1 Tax=Iris pallida TaxID=29817 RepID=A0AAX6GYS3_IRIPA|nr:scopoletin glucosyltransferase-like [Iris pallida]
MSTTAEVLLVPIPHPGHLFPFAELCSKLTLKGLRITILYPSHSDPPSSLLSHPLVHVRRYPHSHELDPPQVQSLISRHVSDYIDGRDRPCAAVAVVDDLLSWLVDSLSSRGVPAAVFFTTSAASCAIDRAVDGLPRGEILAVEGLPDMGVTSSVPRPGAPKWRPGPTVGRLAAAGSAVALLFNTCRELERPFLDYMAREEGKPVWAVGPLLRPGGEPEGEGGDAIRWLDRKPRGSVIYVSFGSLVRPGDAELAVLADGLVESNRDFIWVTKSDQLADRLAGTRGLVVKGWAPQLAILGHASTGGFVCHCGWNSTLEALRSGVPMLTWPVRGDQFLNARLVTHFLKVGIPLKEEADVEVKRGDVAGRIERLLGDVDIKKRAESVRSLVGSGGFPESSSESVDRFVEFVSGHGK